MRIKFDAKTVARFKLPDNKKEEIYWDEELRPIWQLFVSAGHD